MTILAGFDYETEWFGPEKLTPPPVCLSAFLLADDRTQYTEKLLDPDDLELATAADGDLAQLAYELVTHAAKGEITLVGANSAFDLAVACNYDEDLWEPVFVALNKGTIKDVQVREKLLDLADNGDLEFELLPDGGKKKKITSGFYTLAGLVRRYLGVEMEDKAKIKKGKLVGEADSWRLNYEVLMDVKLKDWPEDAVTYSLLDSVYPTLIYNAQEIRRKEIWDRIGMDPLKTEDFRCKLRFSFYLMSARGMAIDGENHLKICAEMEEILKPENMTLIVEAGILRPGTPAMPYANNAKKHADDCSDKKDCDCPPKMKAAKKASMNKKRLIEFVEALAREDSSIKLRYTEKGNLQVDMEFLADYALRSPILIQLQNRQKVQKLVTTDLPRMEWPPGSGIPARIVHPSFDFLKETGRSSSFASSAYPSMCCQNPHPRVRHSIVPRPGYVLYSVDYSGMELGTLAQRCLDLFGYSVLADKINAGYDAHAYLGSQLAHNLDGAFRETCDEGSVTNPDAIYQAFLACKGHELEDVAKFFKHYRTFAKPTGLGYPGGLGAETFVDFAWATYKVNVTEEQAKELKKIWLNTYPEMVDYFRWINKSCPDPHWPEAYAYSTRMGMYRANCSYCACANGAALQSPAAEGALLAVNRVVEETFRPTVDSILQDDKDGPRHRPLMFLHDELIGEARMDVAHEVSHRVAAIMIEAMRTVTPDVIVGAVPVLMTRWDKRAEQVWDDGRLVAYDPFKQEKK